jgi:Shikimate kinase
VLSGHGSGAAAQRGMSFAGIALIGLRGAGKSTLGKMLAKKIGWNFVELNKEIESQNGLSVAEIIALYGQEGFRRMEQAALGQLLARKELTVLATGGGIVSEPLTFDLILHHLAEGRTRRTHGAGAPPGRSASDGGRPLGDGGIAHHPAQPRTALCAGFRRGRHRRAQRGRGCGAFDRCGGAGAA